MINMMKSAVSLGVGVVDEGIEWWDERSGRAEPFRRATDIVRLLGAGLGYAMQVFWPQQQALGEALALSTTPLLVKSVAKPIRSAISQQVSAPAFVPRRAPAGTGTVSSRVASYPASRTEPEFSGIRLI